MTAKEKPAPGGNRAAGYGDASTCVNHTPIRSRLKAVIVSLAVWGLIPAALGTWLIQRGGLNDA